MKSIFFVSAALFALTIAQQCPQYDIVLANGIGRRVIPSSVAVIRMSIQKEALTPTATQRKIAHASKKLISFLKGQKVKKLKTLGVSLYPIYNYRSNVRKLQAYRGSNKISFEVPVSNAGRILDAGVRNGATRVAGVSFKPAARASRRARHASVRAAVKMARREAKAAAKAGGASLGRALKIQVTDIFYPTSSSVRSFSRSRRKSSITTPIEAGSETITARVQVTFELY